MADVDWEAIGNDYRAGVKTVRVIAGEHGITHGAINKRAKRDGWTRDIAARVKAKADLLVSKAAVSSEVSKKRMDTENQLVEANAKIQSDIILSHRVSIPNKRELVAKLFKEIEGLTDNTDIVEQMVLALQDGDMEKLGKVAQKVGTLPSRIKGVADLVNAYKTLVGMEREAFGIDKTFREESDAFTEIVRKIIR